MNLFARKLLSVGLLVQLAATSGFAQAADAALVAKAKAIHDRVLKLDTHNDIDPNNFTADCNYLKRLATQVNLPKMVDGDMDVAFFIVYVGQVCPRLRLTTSPTNRPSKSLKPSTGLRRRLPRM